MRQRHTGTGARHRIGRQRQCAECHAMVGLRKRYDGAATGDLSRQLERRLDGIRARGPRELYPVVESTWHQNRALEFLEKFTFRDCVQVERVQHRVVRQVRHERGLHPRLVVPVIHRAGAGEEVDVLTTLVAQKRQFPGRGMSRHRRGG